MRSKVELMKEVAAMIRNHFEGILAWVTTRLTPALLISASQPSLRASSSGCGYSIGIVATAS